MEKLIQQAIDYKDGKTKDALNLKELTLLVGRLLEKQQKQEERKETKAVFNNLMGGKGSGKRND
jgi:hypothetical protein